MKSLLLALPVLAFATAAMAQTVPDASKKDLWCGIAFGIVSADVPPDLPDDQKAVVQQFHDGGIKLVEQAKAAHLANGYTEETFGPYYEQLTADVTTQVSSSEDTAEYTFEECSALLGL